MPSTIFPMTDDGMWQCERCQALRNRPGGRCNECCHWQGFKSDTGCQCIPCAAKVVGQSSFLYDYPDMPF
jgi:hypothetical protein